MEKQHHVIEHTRNKVMGKMMKDIILLETQMAFSKKQMFKNNRQICDIPW